MVGTERLARPAHGSISSTTRSRSSSVDSSESHASPVPTTDVGELALVVDDHADAFLDGAFAHELVDVDGAFLADAPRPVGGLVLDRRVPPAVVVDHLAGRGEVEAGAAGLQRDEQQRRPRSVLECVDHPVASCPRHAPVQERRIEVELVVDVGAQQFAHLAELGEHEGPLVGVEEVGDEFVEPRELAGSPGEA